MTDDVTRIDPVGCTVAEDCAADGHYGNCPRFELVIPLAVRRIDDEER